MTTNEVKELLKFHASICDNLHDYVTEYVDWVKENIDEEFWIHFGVGYYIKNSRLGDLVGFEGNNGRIYPLNWGGDYYWGNDFSLSIISTSEKITKDFAKRIPELIKNGIDEIKQFNEDVGEILKNKIEL